MSNTSKKRSGPEQVAEFMAGLEHPLKRGIEEARQIILSVNDQITEQIKWNAPSFCFNGEDRVTFNLQGKGFFRLIFHTGAKVKAVAAEGPLIEDSAGLLEWVTPDRAIVKFTGMDDVKSKQAQLAELVARWIEAAD